MKDDIQKRIEELREELEKHNYNYYVLDNPTISDYDFDMMMKELQALEKKYPQYKSQSSPTVRVGGELVKSFNTVEHKYRMYSLENVYSKQELEQWEERVIKAVGREQLEFVCELKYDGASISIEYRDGKLVQALTRGDGFRGDDITTNVRTIKSVPLKLKGDYPNSFFIRGEIIITKKGFEKMNQDKIASGEDPYMNPRNTASGSLKLQDSSEVAKRPLDCLLYNLTGDELKIETQKQSLDSAREWGFKVPGESKLCQNTSQVMEFIDHWDKHREELPYQTDGVVVKINSVKIQKELGFTAKSPRWAMAYKFKAERVETVLESISYQVGRTGAITPVANLKPVLLAGTVVRRASLHNADQIEKLDLRVGDRVYVEKGGEIIPKIVGVNMESRDQNLPKTQYITHCPECGSPLTRMEGEAQHYCTNYYGCPPQITGRIQHFISRKAMDIQGLGAETVELLFREKLIENYADLYLLEEKDLEGLERMGEKSAKNVINGIKASTNIPFSRVLFALGIRYVGENVAKKLAKEFESIDQLKEATIDRLLSVEEIGESIGKSIIEFFKDPKNIALVERLKSYGICMREEKAKSDSDKLTGISFVISGVFERHSRDELKDLVERNGGKILSSISSKTNYVLAGENMGPAKLEKANKLGIKIISESEFEDMIKDS